ncbi:TetR/AcrR family transcriptional regulator [Novosphingobium mangrovi (ex Huang et al. 2023)]|uniref:TetR/AcrR family transcriptional regulator n=1 Tax=Novosphingobium mangrovi (ex Huang et al. 2023) TaxID=2976432 RepID=A0ABT2I9Q9_9SPHN|nr:TetR/AcrR family transcriptional regulator [Novosphingobium mangrovi (ex Huang et al. 2023)]MCT2401566.1 TetR/AcrR family transcriptional regulator [Novosphingobium mangrovi (ex Huang et al. 2023)]
MAGTVVRDRLGIEVWLQTGVKLLAEEGVSALTVDRLSATVGRSKGSFYHHFQGVDGFVTALLEYWRKTQTEDVIRHVDNEADPRTQRTALMQQAAGLDHDVERAIRIWGGSDASARKVIKAVDERRIAYLARILAASSALEMPEATDLARIEYAALIGLHQLYPEVDPEFLTPLYERLARLITPGEE